MPNYKRTRLLIDAKVQGAILIRMLMFWMFCVLFITLPLFIAISFTNPEMSIPEAALDIWDKCGPMLTAVVLLLPLACYDLLKLTHKFAGPLFRLHRELTRLADGEHVQPLKFRDADFWQEIANPFNKIIQELNESRGKLVATADGNEAGSTSK